MLKLIKFMLYIFVAVGLVYLLQDILDNSSSVRHNVQSSIIRISDATKALFDKAYASVMSTTDQQLTNIQTQTENMLARME